MKIGEEIVTQGMITKKSAYKTRLNNIISVESRKANLEPQRVRDELVYMSEGYAHYLTKRDAIVYAIKRLKRPYDYSIENYVESFEKSYNHSKNEHRRQQNIAGSKDLSFWRLIPRFRNGRVPKKLDDQVSHRASFEKRRKDLGLVSSLASKKATGGVRLRGKNGKHGKTFFGTSGGLNKGMITLPAVQKRWKNEPFEKWSFQNCAEEEAASKLHNFMNSCGRDTSRVNMKDLEMATFVTETGQPYPQCRNCSHVFRGASSLTESEKPTSFSKDLIAKQGRKVRRRKKAFKIERLKERDAKYGY